MKTLGEATDYLLGCDDPADELVMVDQYIRQYNQDPDRFILPRERAHLAPFISAYAPSMEKWLRFVRAVRDEFAAQEGIHGYKYRQMQMLFRTLEVRYVQQTRRERLRQAVAWLESEHPGLTTDQKKLWCKRLEQLWMKQRRAWLAAHRKQLGKRITLEEQRQVLDDFWADVDDNIRLGNLPRYE